MSYASFFFFQLRTKTDCCQTVDEASIIVISEILFVSVLFTDSQKEHVSLFLVICVHTSVASICMKG